MGQLEFQMTSGALQMTSFGQKPVEMENDSTRSVHIVMMEILQMEMAAKDDAAIVSEEKYIKYNWVLQ